MSQFIMPIDKRRKRVKYRDSRRTQRSDEYDTYDRSAHPSLSVAGVVRCTSGRQRPHQLAILPFRDKRSGLRLLDNPCLSVAIVSRSSERRMLTFTDLGEGRSNTVGGENPSHWQLAVTSQRQCKLLFAQNHNAEPNRTRGCGTSGFLSL